MKQTSWLMLGLGLLVQCCKNPRSSALTEDTPTQTAILEFSCRGTEPFWLVEIYQDSIVYERAGGKKIIYPPFKAQTKGDSTVYMTQAMVYGDTSSMVIKITPDSCSDGMSDHVYPFSVTIFRNGEILKGCAVTDQK